MQQRQNVRLSPPDDSIPSRELPARKLPAQPQLYGSTITKPSAAFVFQSLSPAFPFWTKKGTKKAWRGENHCRQPLPSKDTRGQGCSGNEDARGMSEIPAKANSPLTANEYHGVPTHLPALASPLSPCSQAAASGCTGIQARFAVGGNALIHTLNMFSILNLSPNAFLLFAS